MRDVIILKINLLWRILYFLPLSVEVVSTLLFRFVESDDISEETGTLICEALVPVEDIIALAFFFVGSILFCKS